MENASWRLIRRKIEIKEIKKSDGGNEKRNLGAKKIFLNGQ